MSNLKYKSSLSNKASTNNTSLSTNSNSNQPIWCSLTSPSQIARKYASIAPIWCHISRPRQLKKKFASTFHQAQNLLTRQHSKDSSLKANSSSISDLHNIDHTNGKSSYRNEEDEDDDDENNRFNDITYKNTLANANTSRTISNNMSDLASRLVNSSSTMTGNGHYDHYDIPTATSESSYSGLSLKKRDSSLDTKQRTSNKLLDSGISPSSSYLYGGSNNLTSSNNSNKWSSISSTAGVSALNRTSLKSQHSNYDVSGLDESNTISSAINSSESSRRPNKYISSSGALKYSNPGLSISGGSKTERIISKSSKSSPNLMSSNTCSTKDYYTDKYDLNTNKWTSNATSSLINSSNPYLSSNNNTNSYLGSSYHSTPYYSSTTITSNNPPSSYQSYNSNDYNNNYSSNSYTNYPSTSITSSSIVNNNREEKWNELDSMLGAQSALLSRLESDFVANRNKLMLNTATAATSSTSSSSSSTSNLNHHNQTNNFANSGSYQPSSSKFLASNNLKTTPPSIQTTSSLLANKYLGLNSTSTSASSYLTPSNSVTATSSSKGYSSNNNLDLDSLINGYTNRYRTPTSKKFSSKYATSKAEEEVSTCDSNFKKCEEQHHSPMTASTSSIYLASSSKKNHPIISSTKTEPLIDLIKNLELNSEERKKQLNRSLTNNNESDNGISNYNSAISSAEKFNMNYEDSIHDLKEAIGQIASNQAQQKNLNNKITNDYNTKNKTVDSQINNNTNTDFVDDFINDYINNTLNQSNLIHDEEDSKVNSNSLIASNKGEFDDKTLSFLKFLNKNKLDLEGFSSINENSTKRNENDFVINNNSSEGALANALITTTAVIQPSIIDSKMDNIISSSVNENDFDILNKDDTSW
jgi:hypothetical protein